MDGRYGIIAISTNLIDREPQRLVKIFSLIEFLPMAIEEKRQEFVCLYKGFSPHFDKVLEGYLIPTYTVYITLQFDEEGKEIGMACDVKKYAYSEGRVPKDSIQGLF